MDSNNLPTTEIRKKRSYEYKVGGLRHMRTTQEIRLAVGLGSDEDAVFYQIQPRGKRTNRSLPSVWSDKAHAAGCYEKCWKHYSKKKCQWG